jgi:2-dehydro-3-deoxyphosphooctonate aldolase (KDO 8-P synthase)
MQNNNFYGNWDGFIREGVYVSRRRPVIMAGPCMLETKELGLNVGKFMQNQCKNADLPYVFKTSYDKANRTSSNSQRGPGLSLGIQWLQEIKEELNVPILIDVHTPQQALDASKVADIIQIPAFLFQQRELLAAAASTGKVVQIKKGQWASSEEMLEVAQFIVDKCNNNRVILVERGTNFGYNNLVVDFRNLVDMAQLGHAVIFDATHAVQLPGAGDGKSSGLRNMVPYLLSAALAVGVDGIFMETHENPAQALSDADTQLSFDMAAEALVKINKFVFGNKPFINELKTPLTLILNTANHLKSEMYNNNIDKHEIISFISEIENAVEKLSKLLKTI